MEPGPNAALAELLETQIDTLFTAAPVELSEPQQREWVEALALTVREDRDVSPLLAAQIGDMQIGDNRTLAAVAAWADGNPDVVALVDAARWGQIVQWAVGNDLFVAEASADQSPMEPPAVWARPWAAILRNLADHEDSPDREWLNLLADRHETAERHGYSTPVKLPKVVSFPSETAIDRHDRIEGGYVPVAANVFLPPGTYAWDWVRQETVRLDIIDTFDPDTYQLVQGLTAEITKDDLAKASRVSYSARIVAGLSSRLVWTYAIAALALIVTAVVVYNA